MSSIDTDSYWTKILGQANVTLDGASKAQLHVALFDVLEEFFDGSNCWQESLQVIVVPDTQDYTLAVQSGIIRRLLCVLDQNNVSQPAVMPVLGTLHFLYPYSETQPMTAIVVKSVSDPLTIYPPNIPDWTLPAHGLAIMHGLIGNMMQQPGQSYSNPPLAMFHLQKFRDGIAHARVAMMKMNTVGAQAWMFPQQFRTFGQKGGVSTFNVLPTPR